MVSIIDRHSTKDRHSGLLQGGEMIFGGERPIEAQGPPEALARTAQALSEEVSQRFDPCRARPAGGHDEVQGDRWRAPTGHHHL